MVATIPQLGYNITPPGPYPSGTTVPAQGDAFGNAKTLEQGVPAAEDNTIPVIFVRPQATASPTGSWTPYTSAAKVGTVGLSINAAPCNLRLAGGINSHATNVYYLLVIDKASPPVNNDLPAQGFLPVVLPPASAAPVPGIPYDPGEGALKLINGAAFAISTTIEKVTLPATSDCIVALLFK